MLLRTARQQDTVSILSFPPDLAVQI